jgi:glycosyltransferase involved in cell wall biosynthesis
MNLSVIIPSKTRSNVLPCIAAIRAAGVTCRVIVIDDGIEFGEECGEKYAALPVTAWPFQVERGVKPFIFARNVNLGIRSAGDDDVILLNDDALLETPGGFTAMQRAAEEHPEYGVISATTNLAGNPDQRPRGVGLRDAGAKCVAFVCVLIPRRTIERVGLLDERFIAYGWEDNDYCRRVREAGLKVGIFDGCYVDHGSLKSTFRGDPRAAGDIHPGARIYQEKWGDLA